MRGQDVEIERFDMGHRVDGFEARNVGDGRMRSHIDENLGPGQRARPAVVQAHLEGFRPQEAPRSHDQFGAAFLVVLQMRRDEPVDHVALALANLRHVDLDRAGHHAELGAVSRVMRDFGAVNFVLARQARDIGTAAADPLALDDRDPAAQAAVVPGGKLAPAAAAEDKNVVLFGLRHEHPPRFTGENR